MSSSTQCSEVRGLVLRALRQPECLPQLPLRQLDLAIRVLRRAQLLAHVAWRLREAGELEQLPAAARDAMLGALVIAESRARVARWELNRIALALADESTVPLIALKGCAYLLAGTPNANGRVFADVDLLVPEASLERIASQLTANGWQVLTLTPYDDNYYRVWSHELPPLKHVEREVEIDLHHNVQMRTSRLRPDANLLIAKARRLHGSRYSVLSPADMVLHAMTHLFYGGEMDDALRELVDIDILLRQFSTQDPRFWDGFWSRAEQLDLARPVFYGLRYARRLLGTPVPESVVIASRSGAPPAPVVWLMDRLVPATLFPQHPDRHRTSTALARLALYVRSHWVRMPPLMLVSHLTYKFRVRYMGHAS